MSTLLMKINGQAVAIDDDSNTLGYDLINAGIVNESQLPKEEYDEEEDFPYDSEDGCCCPGDEEEDEDTESSMDPCDDCDYDSDEESDECDMVRPITDYYADPDVEIHPSVYDVHIKDGYDYIKESIEDADTSEEEKFGWWKSFAGNMPYNPENFKLVTSSLFLETFVEEAKELGIPVFDADYDNESYPNNHIFPICRPTVLGDFPEDLKKCVLGEFTFDGDPWDTTTGWNSDDFLSRLHLVKTFNSAAELGDWWSAHPKAVRVKPEIQAETLEEYNKLNHEIVFPCEMEFSFSLN